MRRQIIAVVATSVALLWAAVAVGADPRPSITVSGHGDYSGAPDLALLSFAVETAAPDASTAMAENATKSQAVTAVLKGALGASDLITTTGYSLDPVYDHQRDRAPDEPPAITGYVARNQVSVETADTKGVGRLIDLAAKAGANRISGLQFTLKEKAQAQAKALEIAAKDAAHQAQTIAASLGLRLGPVLHASTVQPGYPEPRAFVGHAMAMEARAATTIEPGEVRVDATVHVTYAIE